jgi:hypothetical protein
VRVPVRYGDASRQAQTIIQENSANDMPSTPLMTFYITDLEYDRPRMQEPYFVSNIQVRQRTYDADTDTYETTQGNAFTIERLMPVPLQTDHKSGYLDFKYQSKNADPGTDPGPCSIQAWKYKAPTTT